MSGLRRVGKEPAKSLPMGLPVWRVAVGRHALRPPPETMLARIFPTRSPVSPEEVRPPEPPEAKHNADD